MAGKRAVEPVPGGIATVHELVLGDARAMSGVADESVGVVVCSPPYWTLKHYSDGPDQLGAVEDYERFNKELGKVWDECFRALLPGGRLCIVVGDVCLSRRQHGRHRVMPLHADILVNARVSGFDVLTPISWLKRTNMKTEMDREGSYFLGKPFEPNGIIKNDIESILLLRKPGDYRKPTEAQRELSRIPKDDYFTWYRSVWSDVTGASTRNHPAPYPLEIPRRLVQMFSFVDDIVLDPFLGTGTTAAASAAAGRHSIGYDIESDYIDQAEKRLGALKLDPSPTVTRRVETSQ